MKPDSEISKTAKAGQVRMDRAPGRIGFMSTQRRASRRQRLYCTVRAETSVSPGDESSSQGRKVSGFGSAFGARYSVVDGGRTAPVIATLWSLFIGWPQTLCNRITISNRSCRLDRHAVRRPSWARRQHAATASSDTQVIPSHIPFPARARLHPSLPQVPAGQRRWAERYDGKRNLYLQHAA